MLLAFLTAAALLVLGIPTLGTWLAAVRALGADQRSLGVGARASRAGDGRLGRHERGHLRRAPPRPGVGHRLLLPPGRTPFHRAVLRRAGRSRSRQAGTSSHRRREEGGQGPVRHPLGALDGSDDRGGGHLHARPGGRRSDPCGREGRPRHEDVDRLRRQGRAAHPRGAAAGVLQPVLPRGVRLPRPRNPRYARTRPGALRSVAASGDRRGEESARGFRSRQRPGDRGPVARGSAPRHRARRSAAVAQPVAANRLPRVPGARVRQQCPPRPRWHVPQREPHRPRRDRARPPVLPLEDRPARQLPLDRPVPRGAGRAGGDAHRPPAGSWDAIRSPPRRANRWMWWAGESCGAREEGATAPTPAQRGDRGPREGSHERSSLAVAA